LLSSFGVCANNSHRVYPPTMNTVSSACDSLIRSKELFRSPFWWFDDNPRAFSWPPAPIVTLSNNIFSFCGAFRHTPGPGGRNFFVSLKRIWNLSLPFMMFTSLLRGRSVTVHSLTQKEKGLSDLKFREEICLSVCVSVEALS